MLSFFSFFIYCLFAIQYHTPPAHFTDDIPAHQHWLTQSPLFSTFSHSSHTYLPVTPKPVQYNVVIQGSDSNVYKYLTRSGSIGQCLAISLSPSPLHLSVQTLRLYFSLLTHPLPSCDLRVFYCDDLCMPSSFSLSIFPLPFILYPCSFLPTHLGLHARLQLASRFKTTQFDINIKSYSSSPLGLRLPQ